MGKAPNFEELVKIYIENEGANFAIQIYSFLKNSWINNEYQKTDFDSIFEYLFTNSIDESISHFKSVLNETTENETQSQTTQQVENQLDEDENDAEQLFAERNKPKKNKQKKKKPITITPQTTKTVPYDLSDIPDEHFMDAVDYVPDGEESTPKDPDDYSEEFLKKNDEVVRKAYEAIKRKTGKAPNFEGLVKILIEKRGADSIIQIYNFLKKSWINNEYQKTDFDSVFEYLFTNSLDELVDQMSSNETTENEEQPETTQQVENQLDEDENDAEQLFAERNKPKKNKQKKKKPITITPQTTKTVPYDLSDIPDEHFMDAVDYVPDGEESTPKDPDDYSEEFLEKMDKAVKKLYEDIKRKTGKAPNFEELIKIYIEQKGNNEAIQLYNFFKRSWINNEYQKTDFDSIFEYLFTNSVDDISDLFNNEESNQTTKEEPKSRAKQILEVDNNSVPEAEAKAIDHVKTTGSPVIQSDEEGNVLKEGEISVFKIATPKLKFAHLSLPYKRNFFYDEEGEIIEDNIKDVGNELNVGQMDTTHLFSKLQLII